MKFVNFEGIQKDIPTSELRVRSTSLDLHNEWDFIGYAYDLLSNRMTLRWRDARKPEWSCYFEFSDVHSVRIEARDSAYPWDHAQRLSTMIYQEPEGEIPFIKLWFEDQSTIEVAADTLTLHCSAQEERVASVSGTH